MTDRLGNVVVQQFRGLAVQFVRECKARVIIRGVRSLSDMEAEFTMTLANRKLDPGIETVFLMADEEFSHVSSSLIKQITPLASDEELARFVPREIIPDLRAKLCGVIGESRLLDRSASAAARPRRGRRAASADFDAVEPAVAGDAVEPTSTCGDSLAMVGAGCGCARGCVPGRAGPRSCGDHGELG